MVQVLWSKDQLSRAVLRGEVFKGFEEGPLLFPPTYKFDVGTDNYDSSAKVGCCNFYFSSHIGVTDKVLVQSVAIGMTSKHE